MVSNNHWIKKLFSYLTKLPLKMLKGDAITHKVPYSLCVVSRPSALILFSSLLLFPLLSFSSLFLPLPLPPLHPIMPQLPLSVVSTSHHVPSSLISSHSPFALSTASLCSCLFPSSLSFLIWFLSSCTSLAFPLHIPSSQPWPFPCLNLPQTLHIKGAEFTKTTRVLLRCDNSQSQLFPVK